MMVREEGGKREQGKRPTPSNSDVSIKSWSFMERISLSLIPVGAAASSMRWVWSGSTGGAGLCWSSF